jgi:hypothetical protein
MSRTGHSGIGCLSKLSYLKLLFLEHLLVIFLMILKFLVAIGSFVESLEIV